MIVTAVSSWKQVFECNSDSDSNSDSNSVEILLWWAALESIYDEFLIIDREAEASREREI